MPWCPKCGTEYREGITTCYDCDGQPLVSTQPSENPPPKTDWERYFDKDSRDHAAYLQTVASDMEADFIESLLRAYEIPVLRKYRQAGAYLKVVAGTSSLGVDLFVPSSALQRAQEILNAPSERITEELLESVPPELREEEPESDYDAQRVRKLTWKLFLGLLTALAAFALLARYAANFIK